MARRDSATTPAAGAARLVAQQLADKLARQGGPVPRVGPIAIDLLLCGHHYLSSKDALAQAPKPVLVRCMPVQPSRVVGRGVVMIVLLVSGR